MKSPVLKAILWGIVVAILGTALFYGALHVWGEYPAKVTNPTKQVYDGDTIKDVMIKVANHKTENSEVWPGVHIIDGDVYIETDIRISGIDTPERRAPTKYKDGTPRPEEERERERQAAYAARDYLKSLIEANQNIITIENAEHGKYAGRTVADVIINDENVATLLIDEGHAIAYEGGTKLDFIEWYTRDLDQ